tara:strand:- start:6695 stop:6877 length:183 start_codon:yes stop_codon:yes gene_type:complete
VVAFVVFAVADVAVIMAEALSDAGYQQGYRKDSMAYSGRTDVVIGAAYRAEQQLPGLLAV